MDTNRSFTVNRDITGSVTVTVNEENRLGVISPAELSVLGSMLNDEYGWGDAKDHPHADLYRLHSIGLIAPMGHGRYEITDLGRSVASLTLENTTRTNKKSITTRLLEYVEEHSGW